MEIIEYSDFSCDGWVERNKNRYCCLLYGNVTIKEKIKVDKEEIAIAEFRQYSASREDVIAEIALVGNVNKLEENKQYSVKGILCCIKELKGYGQRVWAIQVHTYSETDRQALDYMQIRVDGYIRTGNDEKCLYVETSISKNRKMTISTHMQHRMYCGIMEKWQEIYDKHIIIYGTIGIVNRKKDTTQKKAIINVMNIMVEK